MQYKITTVNAENSKESNIQKLGVVINFTLAEVEQHEVMLAKAVKEIVSKRDYEQAKMTNIETHHPFVLTMPEQDVFTCSMYQEAKDIVHMAVNKLAEIEKQLADYVEEKAEIIKQIPELADVPANSIVEDLT